ncbi:tyrosine-type recombinase/integrase [Streptomyces sp. NPDC006365]|uniref:tyrosine-type recombinase/integrase n=1 Tax=Streptomyces sp. NPDC006365 TaxID=3364744 RepID=UPI00369DB850
MLPRPGCSAPRSCCRRPDPQCRERSPPSRSRGIDAPDRNGSHWRPTALFLAPVDEPGPRFDAECEENNAFRTWAGIEILRCTGARIEELLELTHLSLRQYQAPTGETVPLLQISPSKTDRERVIPADPDLVAVLARIIRRIKGTGERVPLLTRYDGYERIFGPPMPHLFQRLSQHRLQVVSPNRIRELLTDHALKASIVDVDGSPLRFTPHDFRRIFSTETVNGGLPIHIAAKLLGHLDLNTTQDRSRGAEQGGDAAVARAVERCQLAVLLAGAVGPALVDELPIVADDLLGIDRDVSIRSRATRAS